MREPAPRKEQNQGPAREMEFKICEQRSDERKINGDEDGRVLEC
jgi:hypothetical protein